MNDIENNLKSIQNNILKYKTNHNILLPVELIAVSKNAGIEKIKELYSCGISNFGENIASELYNKAVLLSKLNINWHFIGNIQSNKIKSIAKVSSWVHSLTQLSHAIILNKERNNGHLSELNVLIEVNISNEKNKHGLIEFSEVFALAQAIQQLSHLKLRGLMGIASQNCHEQIIISQFSKLSNWYHKLKNYYPIDTLSMGMSNDYLLAIQCGANMIRIGRNIFGKHNKF